MREWENMIGIENSKWASKRGSSKAEMKVWELG